jgi:hypothetical protein
VSAASAIATGFFTCAAAGILVALLVVPFKDFGRFFFALNAGIAFGGLSLSAPLRGTEGVAGPAAGSGGRTIDLLDYVAALGTLVLVVAYLIALYLPRRRERRGLLAAGACSALVTTALDGWRAAADGPAWAFAASALSAAILLGFVIVAMNVGHWYLVRTRLAAGHLLRFAAALALAVAARALMLAIGLAAQSAHSTLGPGGYLFELTVARGFFFWQRMFFGILGPAAFSWMIYQTARIRSTQSATGILYIAIIFVVIGEFLARYLTVAGAGPL